MCKVKVIANYLPQFHEILENNAWWGKGFTDWEATKKSVPLYEGHNQPRIPLDNHYYKLDDVNEIRWQAELARKYNVYGFAMYHYWFSSQQNLLHKPAEIIYANKDINIHYMFVWDNTSWVRTWDSSRFGNDWAPKYDEKKDDKGKSGVLALLEYGSKEEWKKHFDYLLPFFKDERYIKLDGKPLFVFYQPLNQFETIKNMSEYWNELAMKAGLNGVICITRELWKGKHLPYGLKYAPSIQDDFIQSLKEKIKRVICSKLERIYTYDYDERWTAILKLAKNSNENTFLSGFVDYDDSPRRAEKACVAKGGTPNKFYKYMKKLLKISKIQNKEYVFVTAWNEWGESAYLEPDETNKFAYLEALKQAVDEVNGIGK